jgi:hypothetical protein
MLLLLLDQSLGVVWGFNGLIVGGGRRMNGGSAVSLNPGWFDVPSGALDRAVWTHDEIRHREELT